MADIHDLPAELLHAIFEWLWLHGWSQLRPNQDSYRDLKNASLVCSDWRAQACRCLFRDFCYSFQRVPDKDKWAGVRHGKDGRWGQHFGEPEKVPYKTLEELLAFLQNRPDIATSVKSLRLTCYPTQWRTEAGPQFSRQFSAGDRIDPAMLASLLRLLPQLSLLRTRSVVPTGPLAPGFQIDLPALKCLIVSFNSRQAESRDAEMLLRCFATVPHLELQGNPSGVGGAWQVVAAPDTESRLALERLTLVNVSSIAPGLLHTLVHSPTVHSLRVLRLEAVRASALPAVQAIINAAGAGVTTVRFDTLTASEHARQAQVLDFSACQALERLTLSIDLEPENREQMEAALATATAIFGALTAGPGAALRNLTDIVLELCIDVLQHDGSDDGHAEADGTHLEQALDALIERSSVTKITVYCVCDPDAEAERAAVDMVKNLFPGLHNRQRLEIETDADDAD
ncbi:hypothetical protein PsYK624_045000 [Phanerochaete sordida]|uniref:F-box domain-containing protein n=1 Tax=Phanerochaete sordida TaxID=48140 RepID=A0A9P3G3H1_9APHY|nr:hypothetical protein PsYK624_045000 [Phanerochaete sordida]